MRMPTSSFVSPTRASRKLGSARGMGALFLERFNAQEAATCLQEALEIDENYAPAYLGLARVLPLGSTRRPSISRSRPSAQIRNSSRRTNCLPILRWKTTTAKAATDEAQKALALSSEALDAMAVLASIDWLDGKAAFAVDGSHSENQSGLWRSAMRPERISLSSTGATTKASRFIGKRLR